MSKLYTRPQVQRLLKRQREAIRTIIPDLRVMQAKIKFK